MYPSGLCPTRCFMEATPENFRNAYAPSTLRSWATLREASLARFLVILREPAARDLSWFNHAVRLRRTADTPKNRWLGGRTSDANLSMESGDSLHATYDKFVRWRVADWTQCVDERNGKIEPSRRRQVSYQLYIQCYRPPPYYDNLIARGFYAAQLQGWVQAWRRDQILVTTFDDVVANPHGFFTALVKFLGLIRPSRAQDRLPAKNSGVLLNDPKRSVDTMWCSTLRVMERLNDPWNQALYRMEPQLRQFERLPCV